MCENYSKMAVGIGGLLRVSFLLFITKNFWQYNIWLTSENHLYWDKLDET